MGAGSDWSLGSSSAGGIGVVVSTISFSPFSCSADINAVGGGED